MIISASEAPSSVFFLKKGAVRMFLDSEEGVDLTIHIYNPGSFFPLQWTIGHLPNKHNYEAITHTEVYIAPADKVIDYLKTDPQASFVLAERLSRGLMGMSKRIETTILGRANNRVASILIYLAGHFGEHNGKVVTIRPKFTHQAIASLAGITRERVSLEMERLQKEGLIERKPGALVLLDLPHLEKQLYRGGNL